MSGKLFLVPNTLDFGVAPDAAPAPLTDVLPHGVLRVAARLPCWVVENARTTRAFLKRVGAEVPLARALQDIRITELPRPQKGAKPTSSTTVNMLQPLLAPALQGEDMGLLSEAGLPAVADPGAALVQEAHRLGIEVVALAGPSSLLLALAASGLNGQSFAFVGYLPVDAQQRTARIRELEALSRRVAQTQLFIETPYRNETMLSALVATLSPTTRLSVSCGLTLPQAWNRSDSVAQWKASAVSLPRDVPAVFGLLG